MEHYMGIAASGVNSFQVGGTINAKGLTFTPSTEGAIEVIKRRRTTIDEALPVADRMLDWLKANKIKSGVWAEATVILPFVEYDYNSHPDAAFVYRGDSGPINGGPTSSIVAWSAWRLLRARGRIVSRGKGKRWYVTSYRHLNEANKPWWEFWK